MQKDMHAPAAGQFSAGLPRRPVAGIRLEVKGPRELAFFPGIARGPVYEGFRYQSEAGAHAALVSFRSPVGRGYSRAGPATAGSDAEGAAGPALRCGHSQGTCCTPGWVTCRDYTNGGPAFWPSEGGGDLDVLAVYAEKGDALAAVRCAVGGGTAVLVGTHPELDPRWLQHESDQVPAVEEKFRRVPVDTSAVSGSAVSVKEQLERSAKERHLFWTGLLQAAGLAEYLCASIQ